MSSNTSLQSQRSRVQVLREEHDRRERTVVDLRMIQASLQDRVIQRERRAPDQRTDDELVEHVKRLLRRHASARRQLGYLDDAVDAVDLEDRAADHFERSIVPALALDGPGESTTDGAADGGDDASGETGNGGERSVPDVSFDGVTGDSFPAAVLNFLASAADDPPPDAGMSLDQVPHAGTVRSTYRDLIRSDDRRERLRALAVVGALLEVAQLAVAGDDSAPITGTRTRLRRERADHVDALAEHDRRRVDDDARYAGDPLSDLGWTDPVAMLPVRLETRFDEGQLKVRVYPEQLHVDTHEEQLTEDELAWGRQFWTRLWVAGLPDPTAIPTVDGQSVPLNNLQRTGGELVVPSVLTDDAGNYRCLDQLPSQDARETALELLRAIGAGEFSDGAADRYEEVRERAWAQGIERFGEERATYVVDALAPTSVDSGRRVAERLREGFAEEDGNRAPLTGPVDLPLADVDMRPESWTQAPRAELLPDRFVVRAHYPTGDGEHRETEWKDVTPEGSDLEVYERREGTEWVRRVAGPAVREPLAVGPRPESVAAATEHSSTAGEEGPDRVAAPEMQWMTRFAAAVDAGLGIEVPLPTEGDYDPAVGFSRVVVTGAKTTMDAAHSRTALSELLAATDHTDGLELLAPGTPTNNADESSARSSRADPAASVDVATGRSVVTARDGEGPTDGARLADALGVPRSTFSHVPGAGGTRDRDTQAANRALWPGTIGYTVRNLLVPALKDEEREEEDRKGPFQLLGTGPSEYGEGPPRLLKWLETYRDHFVDYVRGGGPFQTLLAGNQPYGVLPVVPLDVAQEYRRPVGGGGTGLDGARPDSYFSGSGVRTGGFDPASVPRIAESEFVPEVIDRILGLRDEWLSFAEDVPSIGDNPSLSDERLLTMLAAEATAASYRRRPWLLGNDNPVFSFPGQDPEHETVREQVSDDGRAADLPSLDPRIAGLLFLNAFDERLPVLDGDADAPIVDDDDPGSYLELLGAVLQSGGPVSLLRKLGTLGDTFDGTTVDPDASVLRQVVRFGALQAAIASRVRLGAIYGYRPGEYVEFPAEPTAYKAGDRTVFDLFDDGLPTGTPVDGNQPLSKHPSLSSSSTFRNVLTANGQAIGTGTPAVDPALTEFTKSLAHLVTVDPDRLGRLTVETMDLASHRLDAWWTSLATRQLAAHRQSSDAVHIGAYGFVEDLAPESGAEAEYLLAPSIDQATTASVLRSAHSARSAPQDPDSDADETAPGRTLAIDCSPSAVKLARPVMRGIRRGLDLSEILGQRFERGLRATGEGDPDWNPEQYLDVFRAAAPTVEGKAGRGKTTADTRAADLTDGLRLYRLWKAGTLSDKVATELDGQGDLPDRLATAIGGTSLADGEETGVFPAIHQTMGAVADVLTTEGVHHLIHGRPERASAALDALSRGKTPPEPTALDTPRSETGVTHRLLLVFGSAPTASAPEAWSTPQRPLLGSTDLPSIPRPLVPDPLPDGRDLLDDLADGTVGGPGTIPIADLDDGGSGGGAGNATAVGSPQVRETAEPALDAWVGKLLPGPASVGCTGEFQWERDREFAVGEFETPAAPGTVTVDGLGFRPDVIQFTAVPADPDDGPTTASATGWGLGAFKRAVGEYDAVQTATGVAINPDGTVDVTVSQPRENAGGGGSSGSGGNSTGAVAIEVPFAVINDDGNRTRVSASVATTTTDGFEVDFHDVVVPNDGPERVAVQYRALRLADPTSVRVGTFTTPATPDEGSFERDIAGYGIGGSEDDFAPDHVTFSACLPVGDASEGQGGPDVGFAQGEAMGTVGGPVQQTTGIGLDVGAGDYRVTVRDDDALAVETGGAGFSLSVEEFHSTPSLPGSDPQGDVPPPTERSRLTLSAGAPGDSTYPGETVITYVAVESPTVDTLGGPRRNRPAIGTAATPESQDETVRVDAGFQPGLVELRLAPGATGQDADDLPVSTAVDAGGAGLSLGAATGTVVQRSLATGVADDGATANRDPAGVGGVPLPGDDGPTGGLGVRVDTVDERGFELSFSNLPADGQPLVQYRTWPEAPESQAFAVGLEWPGRPNGLSFDDLDLSPLDAVAITQGVAEAGDSQLERRLGYEAFRNRPANRPPVPADATLDLSFTEPGPDYEVSVAEYVELAGRVRDLVGEARPADAGDLAHPGEASGPGYLPPDDAQSEPPGGQGAGGSGSDVRSHGTASELAGRATQLRQELSELTEMLTNRHQLLSPDENVCDRVGALEDGVRYFHRAAPVNQVLDVTADLAATHPNSRPTSVEGTILAELSAVAAHIPAGPISDIDADIVVEDRADQTVGGTADVDGETDLSVAVHSHSDAIYQSILIDDEVTTDASGSFATSFDFGDYAPGTELFVVGRPRDDERAPTPTALLERSFEDPVPDDWTFVDEPPRSTRTSDWEFDADAGELHQTSNLYGFEGPPHAAPGTMAVTGDDEWTDYRTTVALTSEDDDAIGVVVRYQDPENYYRFSMDAEREYRRLVRRVDGEATVLWEESTGYEPGETYRVTLECEGDRIIGALDGDELFAVRDKFLARGGVGLYCRANVGARFHEIRVTTVGGSGRDVGPAPVFAADGRVVPGSKPVGGRPLPAVVAEGTYLPTLLWLDRVLPDFAPNGGPMSRLQVAKTDATLSSAWDTVQGEIGVMRTMRTVLGQSGDDSPVSRPDIRAVRALLSLQNLDLQALREALRAIIRPVAWTGLTELVSLTGDHDRPADQRYWHAAHADLQSLVEKHPNGEVRARLERIEGFPDIDARAETAAYSFEVRRGIAEGRLEEELIVRLEAFAAEPAGLVSTFGDLEPALPTLVGDVHGALHHARATTQATTRDLLERVESFVADVNAAGRTDELEELVGDPATLVETIDRVRGDFVDAFARGQPHDGSAQITAFLRDYGGKPGRASDIATEELADRILTATEHEDIATAFRNGVLESVRHLLLRVSYFGIYGSVPTSAAGGSPADEDILVAQIERVRETATERLAADDALVAEGQATVDSGVDRLQSLLGEEFVVLPSFSPTNPGELHATLSADLGTDRYDADTWLQRIGRVRDLPRDFQRVRSYADGLNLAEGGTGDLRRSLSVGQLPHVPGQEWIGRDGVEPSGGELSLGVAFANEFDETQRPVMAGMLVDEWVQRVPDHEETVGLGLRYDDPSSRAPQSILLAVPPTWKRETGVDGEFSNAELVGATRWTEALVRQTIEETRSQIRVRSVDLDDFDNFGHPLPMLFFADNRRRLLDGSDRLGDAPSVDFGALPWRWSL